MDLSKAYFCFPRDIVLTKRSAYGFDKSAIALIANYLSNRYQRVKIGSTFSSYLEILRVVPQGSILSPVLFNHDINDVFFSFSFKKQKSATLRMIQQFVHAHQSLKKQL